MKKYNFNELEKKWQNKWEENRKEIMEKKQQSSLARFFLRTKEKPRTYITPKTHV